MTVDADPSKVKDQEEVYETVHGAKKLQKKPPFMEQHRKAFDA